MSAAFFSIFLSTPRGSPAKGVPGHLPVLGPPGQDGEGAEIRPQILVAFVDAHKTLDAAAVDHDLVVHGLFDLAGGDGHVFQLAENIGELHPDEFHIIFPHHADDVFLAVLAHEKASFTK